MMIPLLRIFCQCCGKIFYLGRCCYRGHVYCSIECRKAGYREVHARAERQYRQTEKGKIQHKNAEHRRSKRSKESGLVKNMIKKSCLCLAMTIRSIFEKGCSGKNNEGNCDKCQKPGFIVDEFPYRGYGTCHL